MKNKHVLIAVFAFFTALFFSLGANYNMISYKKDGLII